MDMRMRRVALLETATLNTRIREAHAKGRLLLVELLVLMAEALARRGYLQAGYSCMHHFCRAELNMSEGEAYRRIEAAKLARRYPVILDLIESGELHLTALTLLSRHLKRLERAPALGLLQSAKRLSKSELELLLAERFPQDDLREHLKPAPANHTQQQQDATPLSLATVSDVSLTSTPAATPPEAQSSDSSTRLEPAQVLSSPPSPAVSPSSTTRVTPRSPGRFALQTMLAQSAHDDLRAVQGLLSHTLVNPSDLGQVLARALAIARERLEHTRLAAIKHTERRTARASREAAHIPARVRRAVWKRDGQQCSFVGDSGHRCTETMRLELDHVVPLARGGRSTMDNLRVLCRAHNLFFATLAFGERFVSQKISLARSRARVLKQHDAPEPSGSGARET